MHCYIFLPRDCLSVCLQRLVFVQSTPVLTVAVACAWQTQLNKLHVLTDSDEIKVGLRETPLPVGDGVLSSGLMKIINSESLPGQSLNWLVKLGHMDMDLSEWSRQIAEEAILDRLRVAVLFSINPTGAFDLGLLRAVSRLFKLNRECGHSFYLSEDLIAAFELRCTLVDLRFSLFSRP